MTDSGEKEPPLRDAANAFLDAFETVFHEDWKYTRAQLNTTDDGTAVLARTMGESIEPTAGSMLRPNDDPSEMNWGNYARLLRKYAELCAALKRRPVSE